MHRILLTFDDGPHPENTPAVLDELAQRGFGAIFFVLGEELEKPGARATLRRVVTEGHFVGNHGYSHRNLTRLTNEEIATDFRHTEALIGDLDRGVKLWRPPFGERDARVESVLSSLGYNRMRWNIDSRDWSADAPPEEWIEQTRSRVRARIGRGFENSVCLLHDTLPSTALHLRRLLDELTGIPGVQVARYNPCDPEGISLPQDVSPVRDSVLHPTDALGFEFEGSRVLARARRSTLYILNESAGFLWDTLASGSSESEAARQMADRYGIADDLAAADLRGALKDWRFRGLIGPKAPEMEDPGPWPFSTETLPGPAAVACEQRRGYRLLDVNFEIGYQTAAMAAAVHPRFANLESRTPAADGCRFEISGYQNGLALTAGGSATYYRSLATLAWYLYFDVMRCAHPRLDLMACLHSALAVYGAGSLALVANNGSGKSTLAAALASAGMRVAGDDRLFLDFESGRPAAAPNSIGLKRGSWRVLESRYPAIFELPCVGGDGEEVRYLPSPAPVERLLPAVTHVFFPHYSADAVTKARPMRGLEALERLTASEGWISSEPARLEAFLRWLEPVQCFALPFADLDAAVEQIEGCIRT